MKEVISPELAQYQQDKLRSCIAANQGDIKQGIVFTGDSIIEFFPLKKYLGREKLLINRGIAGTDTNWLKHHLHDQVLAIEPEKLFLLIGTNDIGLDYGEDHIVSNIEDILSSLKRESPSTTVYLLSVLPVSEKAVYQEKVKLRNNRLISSLNHRLKQLPHAVFIDLYPLLLDEDGDLADDNTTDGLHLSQKAYALISEQLKTYL